MAGNNSAREQSRLVNHAIVIDESFSYVFACEFWISTNSPLKCCLANYFQGNQMVIFFTVLYTFEAGSIQIAIDSK